MAFEDLDVWKRSSGLSADIYMILCNIKDYGFRDQITRSGLSIPSNIAEGLERNSDKEKINFLSYAKGSCGELRTQIYWYESRIFIKRKRKSMDNRNKRNFSYVDRPYEFNKK